MNSAPPSQALDRARIVYLVAVAAGVFLITNPLWLAVLGGAQLLAAVVMGVSPRELAVRLLKLGGLGLFLTISYTLASEDPAVDRWVEFAGLSLNLGGLTVALQFMLRIASVVLASLIVRVGDTRGVSRGLRSLGAPASMASTLDAVLALLGEQKGGGGGGGGGGRKRRLKEDEELPPYRSPWQKFGDFVKSIRQLSQGDLAPLVERMERQVERAEQHLQEGTPEQPVSRDAATIAGLSLTMLGVKALKVLPTIPFAPGHKLVLLTPFYIVASLKTRNRAGSTLTGLTMGSTAFLLGDGRYGVFEILKHITPGVLCDLLVPMMAGKGRTPGAWAWSILGAAVGAGRFATILAVTLLAQPPALAWAVLIPGMLVHSTFGALSGYVSYRLVQQLRHTPTRTLTPQELAAQHEVA